MFFHFKIHFSRKEPQEVFTKKIILCRRIKNGLFHRNNIVFSCSWQWQCEQSRVRLRLGHWSQDVPGQGHHLIVATHYFKIYQGLPICRLHILPGNVHFELCFVGVQSAMQFAILAVSLSGMERFIFNQSILLPLFLYLWSCNLIQVMVWP